MKMVILKEKILNAALLAERITGKKESLPVLSCVLLEADKKGLAIRSTNLEASIEIVIPTEVEDSGIIAVPSSVFSQTIRSISSEKITLKTDEGNLLVESRGTKTIIKALPHEEFPKFARADTKGASVSREKLLHALQTVSYAASPSMIRPELGSVYLMTRPSGITCVATDSFRLAEKVIARAGSKDEEDILIPLRHALELAHILERIEDETVEIAADDSQMTLSGSGVRYTSRVVEGTFPDYREIMPKSFETEATVLKNDFSEMLKKARVFSGNDQHVGLHLYPKRKIFSATARSADVGEMSDSIDAALSGEDLDINFHIGYLADCLPSVQSDSITLSFSGAGRPLVIRGASDPSFTYLVMPLNR